MPTPSRTRKALVGGVATLVLAAGALGVAALGPAGAEEGAADGGRSGVLDELVADGTITQEQADAVRDRVREHREENSGENGGHRRMRLLRGALRTSAEAIGIEPDALRERLQAGESIAAVAEAEGVDRQVVVDALMAAGTERIDGALADGRITQEQADAAAARLPDLAARLVDATR